MTMQTTQSRIMTSFFRAAAIESGSKRPSMPSTTQLASLPSREKVCAAESEWQLALHGLLHAIGIDTRMSPRDHQVSAILVKRMIDTNSRAASISYARLGAEIGRSQSTARNALRRLEAGGYFRTIQPSKHELEQGGWTLRYEPLLRPPIEK